MIQILTVRSKRCFLGDGASQSPDMVGRKAARADTSEGVDTVFGIYDCFPKRRQ